MVKQLDSDMLIVAVTNKDMLLLSKILNSSFTLMELNEALDIAASHPNSTKILRLLLDHGAQLDYNNFAPLRSAVFAADPDNAQFLIRHGSPVTAELLADAVATRKADIVKILLKNKANPNIRVKDILPIEYAFNDNQWHLVKILRKYTDFKLVDPSVTRHIQTHFQQAFMTNQDDLDTLIQDACQKGVKTVLEKQGIDPQLFEQFLSRASSHFKDINAIIKSQDAFGKLKNTVSSVKNTVGPELLKGMNVVRGYMPPTVYEDYTEQVKVSYNDLLTYPPPQIKLLAKNMHISDCNNKPHDILCDEIARKLIFVNSEALPFDKSKCSRYTKTLSTTELDEVRDTIYKEFNMFKDSVTTMTVTDLHNLFNRYDELCFNGDIQKYIQDVQYTLKFKTAGEPTFTTEGICTHKSCDYTITIPTAYFKNVNGVTNVAGQSCHDQLECLLRVIEHEMVHLIIFMFCGDTFVTNQHGPLFMTMVKDLFGHTDHRHYIF